MRSVLLQVQGLSSRDRGPVDVTLHGGQRFNLPSRPAPLPLPQAAGGSDAQPAVAPGFTDDPFVVVDVGHASHRHHAGLQHLRGPTAGTSAEQRACT